MKKSYSWSKPDLPNLIGRKVVDLSLLEKRNTGIPKEFQMDFDIANQQTLRKGEKKEIALIHRGITYTAYIKNAVRNDSETASYRIVGIDENLTKIFQQIFKESYNFLKFAYKEKLKPELKKIFVKLPEYLEEYVYFFATKQPFTYEISFKTVFSNLDNAYQVAIEELSSFSKVNEKGPTYYTANTLRFHRNPLVAYKSIEKANFQCEIDTNHNTFISRTTNQPYVEAHHLIPIAYQQLFEKNIDKESNIIALCPTCHRKIHYGTEDDVHQMVTTLYKKKKSDLINDDLLINEETLINMY